MLGLLFGNRDEEFLERLVADVHTLKRLRAGCGLW